MVPLRGRQLLAMFVAALGTIAVIGYSVLAVAQILWLNPIAAMPGKGLREIGLDMASANESLGAPMVIGTMVIGPIGAGAYFIASFGAGMGLADTYGISGADYSPWAWPLYAVSVAAMLSLLGLGLSWFTTKAHRNLRSTL